MTQVPCKNIVVVGAGGPTGSRGFLVLVYSVPSQVLHQQDDMPLDNLGLSFPVHPAGFQSIWPYKTCQDLN